MTFKVEYSITVNTALAVQETKELSQISAKLGADNWLEESINRAGEKAYPYEDRIQYILKEVPISKYANGFLLTTKLKM